LQGQCLAGLPRLALPYEQQCSRVATEELG